MITKKVAIDKLPDPMQRRAHVNDKIPIQIERSAADVHEAYLQKV